MLNIQLLGHCTFTMDEQTIHGISGKKLELLVYLLLNRKSPQSRKTIAFLFYPDSPESQAFTNVRKLFYQLRKNMPRADRYFGADTQSIWWNESADYSLDMDRFEHNAAGTSTTELKEAVLLYKGPLASEIYTDWIDAERERVRQLYISSLEQCIAKLEMHRKYQDALAYAKILLEEDNLKEESYRLVMRLSALTGDGSGALRTFQDCEKTLMEELGITPSAATKEIHSSLREAKPAARQPVHSIALVGRTGEWERLLSTWQSVRNGSSAFVLIEGEAGIGKTRLAEEFHSWIVQQGIRSGFSKCYAEGGDLAFSPVTAWLRSNRLPELNAVRLAEIARLLPELYDDHPDLPVPDAFMGKWQLIRMFDAMEWAVFADRSCVFFLDDIQWCDSESIQWLRHVLRRDSKAKVMIVATKRSGVNKPYLEHLFTDMQKIHKLTTIPLTSLNQEESEILSQSWLEEGSLLQPTMLEKLYKESGGNPLYLVEILRQILSGKGDPSDLSSALDHVMHYRFQEFSEKSKYFISVAAILGGSFSLNLIREALQLEKEPVLELLGTLLEQHIFHEVENHYFDFTHDRLRESVYRTISEAKKKQYHLQIALALETLTEEPYHSLSGKIAYHFEKAGAIEKAVPYYYRAAEAAESIYAVDFMETSYRKLLEIVPRQEKHSIVMKLGKIYEIAGNWNGSYETYAGWLESAMAFITIGQKAECKAAMGNLMILKGNYEEGLSYLKQAQFEFECSGDQQGISNVLSAKILVYHYLGDFDEVFSCYEKRMAIPAAYREPKDDSRTAGILANIYYTQFEFEKAIHWYKEKIRLADGDKLLINHALGALSIVYGEVGRFEEAFACIMEKLELARSLGEGRGISGAVGLLGIALQHQGDFESAKGCLAYCTRESLRIGDLRVAAHGLGLMGDMYIQQNDLVTAQNIVSRAVSCLRKLKTPAYLCHILYYHACIFLAEEDLKKALGIVNEGLAIAESLKRANWIFEYGLLRIRVQHLAGILSKDKAYAELLDQTDHCPFSKQEAKAMVYFECFKIGTATPSQVQEAKQFYLEAYKKRPKVEYHKKYEEMTGENLPPPPRLKELPQELNAFQFDIMDLLAEFDAYLTL